MSNSFVSRHSTKNELDQRLVDPAYQESIEVKSDKLLDLIDSFDSTNSTPSDLSGDSDELLEINKDTCIVHPSKSSTPDANHRSKTTIGKTYDGVIFEVPQTHDMVRSLLDPTLRKSYAEIMILISLLSNFWIYRLLESTKNRLVGFLVLYTFWRLAYNLGIGIVLYKQSKKQSLVNFAKKKDIFNPKGSSFLQRLAKLEIASKMGSNYTITDNPIEFNTWLLFRQLVDLILMQDFTTYMFLVFTSGLGSTLSQPPLLNYTRITLGSLLVGFNLWVKIDAHRVVKDYAWYWGDFFFLEENELTFDGVFNLSPHPMYSIGYIGYYGFALITKSYLVLIVSIAAHALQFAFLNLVEEPHIEKIYGSTSSEFSNLDQQIYESNESYLKPLIVFKNFNPIRISDYLTIIASLYVVLSGVVIDTNNKTWTYGLAFFALITKLVQSTVTTYVLHHQSREKFWTKSYLRYGIDEVTAFANWQIIYNFLLVLSYSSLIGLAAREILSGQYKVGNWPLLRVILGSLLVVLQLWTSSSIYDSIGEFGWFYGDFFLPKFSSKVLTKSGIYRYLNDPERLLGISGIWGVTLITYSPLVFLIAMTWTVHITYFLNFVEKPHMIKIYGEQQVLKSESGVSLTLKQFMPINKLNNTFESIYKRSFGKVDNYLKKRTLSEVVPDRSSALKNLLNGEPNFDQNGYSLKVLNFDEGNRSIEVGTPIKAKWNAPKPHHAKDWIGLYEVLSSGGSRKFTRISSSGKWVATNPLAYEEGESSQALDDAEIASSGEVQFDLKKLWFRQGVYELRYHQNDSHKVLAISNPFEIVVSSIDIDDSLENSLLYLVKKLYYPDSNSFNSKTPLDFKTIDSKELSKLILDSTNIDIATEIILKLRTVSRIAARVKKSKLILDELNSDSL